MVKRCMIHSTSAFHSQDFLQKFNCSEKLKKAIDCPVRLLSSGKKFSWIISRNDTQGKHGKRQLAFLVS